MTIAPPSPSPAHDAPDSARQTGDLRRQPRLKVFSVGSISGAQGAGRCHILNLSPSGALVDYRVTLNDRVVLLAAGAFERQGVVRWTSGSRLGLAFHDPLTQEELTAAL